MRFRGHGSTIAIALSALAVVIAATGTAVAVTTTVVNISDPTSPSHVAHVDSSGRLTTAGPDTTINATGYSFGGEGYEGLVAVTSPTTAYLAVTSLTYDNGYNRQYANTDYEAELAKVTVGQAGTCYDADRTVTIYRHDSVPSGGPSVTAAFPSPLDFAPIGGKKYCIGAVIIYADQTNPGAEYGVSISVGAYVRAGTYTATATTVGRATVRINKAATK